MAEADKLSRLERSWYDRVNKSSDPHGTSDIEITPTLSSPGHFPLILLQQIVCRYSGFKRRRSPERDRRGTSRNIYLSCNAINDARVLACLLDS